MRISGQESLSRIHSLPAILLFRFECRKSRRHTLNAFRRMEHTESRHGSFYFNPYRDVLWLSMDFTDDPLYLEDLQRCYGKQPGSFESLLVEESEWIETSPAKYTSSYLEPFAGLKTILLLLGDDDASHYVPGGYYATVNPEDTEDTAGEDDVEDDVEDTTYGEEADDESDVDDEAEMEASKLHNRADRFKAEYAKFLNVHKGPAAKFFWCIDRDQNIYSRTVLRL
jgi:hypothetical protein